MIKCSVLYRPNNDNKDEGWLESLNPYVVGVAVVVVGGEGGDGGGGGG